MTRIAAVQAATDALNELGLDQSQPIDPFQAIEDTGLVLRFQPLKDLLGAVLPGNPGGVLINSDRPASLQRYTAAHELGHWYLDQDVLSVDTHVGVLGKQPYASREHNAQVFAAHFLMPLELLYPTARRYGITRGTQAEPTQVYQAARDMHVSYEAAVRQLKSIKFISTPDAERLLKTPPARIKQRLADGLRLPNSRGDVWIVDHPEGRAEVEAFVGDAILLRLIEYPATGYRWCARDALGDATVHRFRPAPPPFDGGRAFSTEGQLGRGEVIPLPTTRVDSEVVTLIRDELSQERYQAGATSVGGAVTRLVAYTADVPGEESIHPSQVRPVRPDAPVDRLEVMAHVRGAPNVEFRRRLLAAFVRDETGRDDAGY